MMRKEKEPSHINEDREEEQNSVGPGKGLAATLNGDKGEKGNAQSGKQNTIVERTKGSNQSAGNLKVDEPNGQRLYPHIVATPFPYLSPTNSTKHRSFVYVQFHSMEYNNNNAIHNLRSKDNCRKLERTFVHSTMEVLINGEEFFFEIQWRLCFSEQR